MISLKRSQAFSDAILCESGSASDIELVHDLLAVGLDGFDADFQNRCDLFGRMTLCDEL
jgi:hypothetical protein